MATVELYDTTLRDGAQQEGISLAVVLLASFIVISSGLGA